MTGNASRSARSCLLCAAAVAMLFGAPVRAQDLADLLGSLAACRLIGSTLADMPVAPLYREAGGGCSAGLPDVASAQDAWYLDAACSLPVEVEHTSLAAWCDTVLQPGTLGEGPARPGRPGGANGAGAPVWTLSPGSRLDLGARPLGGVPRPWRTDEVFRRIGTPRGTCELQMRIHAPAPVVDGRVADRDVADGQAVPPAAAGLAMIAWHGGSWSNRGFGSVGLELSVPHFTARGFTVYTPFHRLLGDSPDASAACREADFETDVVADALAAFDWVRDNGARYGTAGAPVLFGQSAGGQLAARVAIERPGEVAAAVLFYAPVDFEDFATRARSGAYTDEQGLGILERVLGVPAVLADVSASPIPQNALPRRIVRDGVEAPPVFMLHGDADSLVESRQSVRLCDALAGRELGSGLVDAAPPGSIDPLRRVSLCGDGSSLHRIRQGAHALDVCPLAGPVPLDSCPSGSEASRQRVADSIGSAAVFAATMAVLADAGDQPPDGALQEGEEPIPGAPSGDGGRGGGGVPSVWWIALLAFAVIVRAGRRPGVERAGAPVSRPGGGVPARAARPASGPRCRSAPARSRPRSRSGARSGSRRPGPPADRSDSRRPSPRARHPPSSVAARDRCRQDPAWPPRNRG